MVTFNYTEEFLRQAKRLAKRYRSLPDDINSLQHELIENPEIGVSLGGGKRKIRGRVIPPTPHHNQEGYSVWGSLFYRKN